MSTDRKPGLPWWRPLVNGLDKRITPPANRLVRTNLFADTVAVVTRIEVRLRRRAERQSTWLLHQYNLPAAGDIRKMRAQLAAVEARLRDMSERMEDAERDARAAREAANGSRTTRRTITGPAASTPAPAAKRRARPKASASGTSKAPSVGD
jgi:hypothetical protein